MQSLMRQSLRAVCVALTVMCLAACATTSSSRDPNAAMLDRERGVEYRLAAARREAQTRPANPSRLRALEQLVFEPKHPDELRLYAIDELLRIDEASFKQNVADRLSQLDNWTSIQRVLDITVERLWTDLTPTLVRSYAREAHAYTDTERPERLALVKLHAPRKVDAIIGDVFENVDDTATFPQQVAAWELLARLLEPEALRERVATAAPRSNLVRDLQAALTDLHVLPTNREAVLWLTFLRDPAAGGQWRAMKRIAERLSPQQQRGLELRHLSLLSHVDDGITRQSREQLIADVRSRLAGQSHVYVDTGAKGAAGDRPQHFDHVLDQLVWADVATVKILFDAVHGPRVVADVFNQADRDFKDTDTELGGVLDIDDNGWYVRPYDPLFKRNDRAYYAAPDLVLRLYERGVHYHLHAQLRQNLDYAGPGSGDMKFARRMGLSCVVFTTVDDNLINVDYYQPNGAIVDLGHITRW